MASENLTAHSESLFTRYPERLDQAPRFPEAGFEDPNVPNPTDQDFVKTVYFVNMAPGSLTGDEKAKLAAIHVQAKIDSGTLPKDDAIQQGSYRAKVMDWILNNKTTWLAKTNDQNSSQTISVKKVEFHTEILLQALQGLTVPASALSSLEKIVKSIGDGITASSQTGSTTQQFWIMLTYYNYTPESGLIQPIVRTISFQATKSTAQYLLGKNKLEWVNFTCQFSGAQFDFNNKTYEGIKDSISQQAIDAGKNMIQDTNVVDIPL